MISKALLKRDIKISLKLWLVITAVMVFLLMALFFATSGMEGSGGMVIQQFYTLFAALIPVFYIGTTCTKLISAQVDNGFFSYVMSAPLRRRKVAFTQAFFLLYVLSAFFGSNELFEMCKYFTVNSLYNPADILACNTDMVLEFVMLSAEALALFLAGGIVFQKKDLPL